jgi:hypothetical protein
MLNDSHLGGFNEWDGAEISHLNTIKAHTLVFNVFVQY